MITELLREHAITYWLTLPFILSYEIITGRCPKNHRYLCYNKSFDKWHYMEFSCVIPVGTFIEGSTIVREVPG